MQSDAEKLALLARIRVVLAGNRAVDPLTTRERGLWIERIASACETMQALTPAEHEAYSLRFRQRFRGSGDSNLREGRAMNAADQSIQRLLLANLEASAKMQAELAAANARMATAMRAPRWREPAIAVLLVAAGLVPGLLAR